MANYRILNRNGSYNVLRLGLKRRPVTDFYHAMLSIPWRGFFASVFGFYVSVNILFALAYFFFGELDGIAANGLSRIEDCFFFSVQTLATIGYGRISPVGLISNLLMTIEALSGLLGFAIVTGLLFARFSRPTSRVLFSNRALLTLHDGVPSLIFRVVNSRASQIAEAKVSVGLVIDEKTLEGEEFRTIYDLKLERDHSAVMAASWTIVHPITQESPLHGHTRETLQAAEAEILVSLVGTDESYAQTIYARHSYIPGEIVWNGAFEDMLTRTDDGTLIIDLGKLDRLKGESAATGPS